MTRPLTWFQPITVPKSSGLTICRINAMPEGMVSPATMPKLSAIASSVAAPSYPDCQASAPRPSTTARATSPAIRIRRGSNRSAITPPTRISTACGNISMPITTPASAGSRVCTAVQARATTQT